MRNYTVEEIVKMVAQDGTQGIEYAGISNEYITIRKIATDRAGTFLYRVFRRNPEGLYEEVDVKKRIREMAQYLSSHITSATIIKEVLEKLSIADFADLNKRLEKKPKVTVGVQKGSCVYLYIGGVRGHKSALQLTE